MPMLKLSKCQPKIYLFIHSLWLKPGLPDKEEQKKNREKREVK